VQCKANPTHEAYQIALKFPDTHHFIYIHYLIIHYNYPSSARPESFCKSKMKSFISVGLVILSVFLMVDMASPLSPSREPIGVGVDRGKYNETKEYAECRGSKTEIEFTCKVKTRSMCKTEQAMLWSGEAGCNEVFDVCCDHKQLKLKCGMLEKELEKHCEQVSELRKECKTHPTPEKCYEEYDKSYNKCCGGLAWWAIVLIVLAVLVVIGAVAVGVILYLRKKKANAGAGAGQMNANNAAAGAYGQPGNAYAGQTEPTAAGATGTSLIYFTFN
jgi:hypothetical protein